MKSPKERYWKALEGFVAAGKRMARKLDLEQRMIHPESKEAMALTRAWKELAGAVKSCQSVDLGR